VAYAISNLPKTTIQIQQPMKDLYLAESSSIYHGRFKSGNFLWEMD
jgi:hypothetical protein